MNCHATPCPRCGAEPTTEWSYYYHWTFHQTAYRCRCPGVLDDGRKCGELGPMAPTPEEAAEAWNKQMEKRRTASCL
jgi:hypothetical protein